MEPEETERERERSEDATLLALKMEERNTSQGMWVLLEAGKDGKWILSGVSRGS